MKRFRFPLRPVAILRAHHEARARETFGVAVRAFVKAEEHLAATRLRVAEFEAALSAGRRGCFSAAGEAIALVAYNRERVAESESEKAVSDARVAMHLRRAEYVEAHRRVEVVGRLEQKARAEHRQECNREEQAGFDDFAGRQVAFRTTVFST